MCRVELYLHDARFIHMHCGHNLGDLVFGLVEYVAGIKVSVCATLDWFTIIDSDSKCKTITILPLHFLEFQFHKFLDSFFIKNFFAWDIHRACNRCFCSNNFLALDERLCLLLLVLFFLIFGDERLIKAKGWRFVGDGARRHSVIQSLSCLRDIEDGRWDAGNHQGLWIASQRVLHQFCE